MTMQTNSSSFRPASDASPVLASRAMLASVSFSKWAPRKVDKEATRETIQRAGAREGAAKVTKQLADAAAFKEIQDIDAAAYEFHKSHTSPWLDNGRRLLSVAFYPEYVEKMRAYREAREEAVSRFTAIYPDLVAQAPRLLGDMFDPNDYPAASEIGDKFAMKTRFLPVPKGADWRVDMSEEEAAILRADVEQANREALEIATRDAFERIAEVVGRMVDRLTSYEPGEKGKRAQNTFKDSLVGNVRDLVEILPVINITGDPRLSDLCARMQAELTAHDADELRDNFNVRESVAKAAQTILDEVSAFMA